MFERNGLSRAALLAGALAVAGCGSLPEGVEETEQGLAGVTPSDIMGFEALGTWTSSSGTVASTTSRTQGAAALAITAPVNFTNVVSGAIASTAPALVGLAAAGSAFAVDLLLPTQQPNPSYFGAIQLYVSVPSRNVNNQFLGNVDLTGRPLGVFRVARFPLTSLVRNALAGATFADMKVTVALNAPAAAKGTYVLDNLRIVGTTAAEFQLTATPAALTVAQGASGQSTLAVARVSGFTSAVAFSATGLPAGVTAAFAPASTTGMTSVVTFSVTPGAALGTSALTIVGQGGGLARAVTLSLTVASPLTFSVSAPAPVTLAPGQTVSIPVTIDRSGGFTGPIQFQTGGLLPGVAEMFFTPTTTAGNQVTLVLTAAANAAPGTNSTTFGASGGLTPALNKAGVITVTIAPEVTFAVSTVAPVTLAPGQTVSIPVTIDRSGGFTGPIQFQTGGLLPGVAEMFFTPTTTSGNQVTLVLTAAANAAPGTNSTTFGASGGLTPALNKAGVITVTIAPEVTFAVSAPAPVTLAPGQTVSIPVTIDRSGGFTGPIQFQTGGLLPGVAEMFFTPTTTSGNQVTLVLTAAANAAPGTNSTTFGASGGLTPALNKAGVITVTIAPEVTFAVSTVAPVTLAPGQTVNIPVTIDRSGGFTGPIQFQTGGLLPGVAEMFFTPTTTSGNQVTLVLTAAANAAPGTNSTTFGASGGLTPALNKAGVITVTVLPPITVP